MCGRISLLATFSATPEMKLTLSDVILIYGPV